VEAACRAVMESMAALRDVLERTGDRKALHRAMELYRIMEGEYFEDEDLELFVEHGEHDCLALIAEQATAELRARGGIGRNKLA